MMVAPYSAGAASGTSAKAALAQSMSFCTVGAPLTPIAPTISPSTLMGIPPPYAATRASVGMPAKSDGSPWIKLKKSCVGTPNRAVYALFCAISMERIGAPSIRLNALRLPPSSRIATFSLTPSSLAFATALASIFCASSAEILCFFTTLVIGHLPPLVCAACRVIPHYAHSRRLMGGSPEWVGSFGTGMRSRAFLGQEHRDVPNKPFRVLVLRAVIGVRVEDQLGIGDVLLEDVRVDRVDDHVVVAVDDKRRLMERLQ